jgi:3',5'-cyclic AMP phosphodiesterase CpdA
MTRVVVTSDLHLGITPEDAVRALAERIADERPDLTVLAGDLGERLDNFLRCLGHFARLPGQVAVLAGNHDVWARHHHGSQSLFERELPQATKEVGFLWLEDASWRQVGSPTGGYDLAVLGSLAWYDYSAADPAHPPMPPEWYAANKGRYNMDAHLIDWSWSDVDLSNRLGDGLAARLAEVEADPTVRTVLVVTHVPLVEAQISRKPGDRRWGISNAYFGNLTTGARVLAFPKVAAIVSGHTHVGKDAIIPHPAGASGPHPDVHVSVVPSDYGTPTHIVVETTDAALAVTVAGPSAGALQQAEAGSPTGGFTLRRAYGVARRTMEIARKKLWPN